MTGDVAECFWDIIEDKRSLRFEKVIDSFNLPHFALFCSFCDFFNRFLRKNKLRKTCQT